VADLVAAPNQRPQPKGAGPFNRLARKQYVALALMRSNAFANSFRTGSGAFEFGARAISFLVYSVIGIGLGIGAGAAAYSLVSNHELHLLAIEFWVLFLLWQAISIVLASFLEQFDLGSLLRFPVNFGSFFLLHLVFGFLDVSTLAGSLSCAGVLIGISLARPDLFGATLAALIGFAAFNIFLVRAIFAWLDRWLAKRRSREIVSAVFLVSMLSLQLLNPVLRDETWHGRDHPHRRSAAAQKMTGDAESLLGKAAAWQSWLPPGLANVVLESADRHDRPLEAGALGLLCIYTLGAAGLLGIRLRAVYRGESLGEAPSTGQAAKREEPWLIAGRGPIVAEIEKELITLFRSMTQIYAICVPPIMVVIIASLFRSGAPFARHVFHLALPVCVAYGLLGFTQLIYNSLGAEGKAIQMVFLFPLPVRTILLAKNLFHGALYLLAAVLAGLFTTLRLGRPDPDVVAITAAWLLFALPANLAAGNVLSIVMPYRINLGRIGRQSGSQANALLSMLIQTTILGAGASVMSFCTFWGRIWLAVPIFLAMAIVAVLGWVVVLSKADALANSRRDLLLEKLARVE
jgi:ABC-2 type transport system permease protein